LKDRKNLAIAILTLFFLFLILSQLDFKIFVIFFKKAKLFALMISFFLYLSTYVLRGIRWRLLTGVRMSHLSLFHIVCLHTLANNIFPFRSGELTLPYFLKKFHYVEPTHSIPALFSARISDILALGVLLIVAIWEIGFSIKRFYLYFALIIVFVVLLFPHIILKCLDIAIQSSFLKKHTMRLKEAENILKEHFEWRNAIKLHSLSLFIWAVKFLSFYLAIKQITSIAHFPLTYWKVVVGTSASALCYLFIALQEWERMRLDGLGHSL